MSRWANERRWLKGASEVTGQNAPSTIEKYTIETLAVVEEDTQWRLRNG